MIPPPPTVPPSRPPVIVSPEKLYWRPTRKRVFRHMTRSPGAVAEPVPVWRMIVCAAPAPVIVVLCWSSRSPTVFPVAAGSPPPTHPLSPLMLSVYVFAPRTIVEPAFAGLFANWTAPRRLQSFAAAVQADAAVSAAPAGSSVRSTVSVDAASVTIDGDTPSSLNATMPRSPFAFCGIGRTAVGASTAALSSFTAAATLRVASVSRRSRRSQGRGRNRPRRSRRAGRRCPGARPSRS